MNLKRLTLSVLPILLSAALLALLFSFLDGGAALALTAPAAECDYSGMTPKTVITVTSGTDPDQHNSYTCYTGGTSDRSPCTLRRAIIEASNAGEAERPILIKFDIPQVLSEGYDATLNIWKIQASGISSVDNAIFRRLEGGQIIIDGATASGDRTDGAGPQIIIVGPGTGQEDGLKVGFTGASGDDQNVICNLGFQNLKTMMYVNSKNNLVADNWFGLNDTGMGVELRAAGPEDGSGNAGVALIDSAEDNEIKGNVFLGLDGVAAALRGKANTFSDNYIGTRKDGTVPTKQMCTNGDWLGGSGITLDGDQIVENNIFAGLRQYIFAGSTQADAISAPDSSDESIIRNNTIGMDSASTEIGVCGRGIYLTSNDHVQVTNNTIVEPGRSGISLNGKNLYDANELRGNTIKKSVPWTTDPMKDDPEDAIELGPSLPETFTDFKPGRVIKIDGTAVTGASGYASDCPNCTIELFLDDNDGINEALQSLVVVTADANGDWTATIPAALKTSEGIRTTSTIRDFTTIPNFSPGTTTGLSELYVAGSLPGDGKTLYLPVMMKQ